MAIALFAVASALLWSSQRPGNAEAGFVQAPAFSSATTSATIAVTTSARILATTTNIVGTGYTRAYTAICNPNANPVFIKMDADKAVTNLDGIPIAAAAGYSVCYEITDRFIYVGSVQASSTNQTSTTISVHQYVY